MGISGVSKSMSGMRARMPAMRKSMSEARMLVLRIWALRISALRMLVFLRVRKRRAAPPVCRFAHAVAPSGRPANRLLVTTIAASRARRPGASMR